MSEQRFITGPEVDALAEVARRMVEEDVRSGAVSASVVDGWWMLHDYVDANDYILQSLPVWFMDEWERWGDYHWSVIQRLEEATDALLRDRPVFAPLPIKTTEV